MDRGGPPDYEPGPFLRFLRRRIWVVSALAGLVTITVMRGRTRHVPDPPPVLHVLPEFSLVDERGHAFTRESLLGHATIVSFLFTRCPSTCPAVTRAMAALQTRYADHDVTEVELISFTVDPEHDTPEVLARHAASAGADPGRWRFVTGARQAIEDLVVGGFTLAVGERTEQAPGLFDIAHSTKLVLVDDLGQVRGYYGSDELGVDEVFHRSAHVLREAREQGRLRN